MKYLKEYIEWNKGSSKMSSDMKQVIEHILVRIEDEMSDVVEMEVDYDNFHNGPHPYIDFYITNDYWDKSMHLTEEDENGYVSLDVSYEVKRIVDLLKEEMQIFKDKYYLDFIKPSQHLYSTGDYILCAKIKKIEPKTEKIEYGTFYKNIKNKFHSDEFESLFTPLLDEYGSDNCLLTFDEWSGTIRVLFKLKTNYVRNIVFKSDYDEYSYHLLPKESNRLEEVSKEVLKDIEIHYPMMKSTITDFSNRVGIDNVQHGNETYSTTLVSFHFVLSKVNEKVEDVSNRDNKFVMDVFGLDKEEFENDIATPLEDEFGKDNILISFGYWPGDQVIEVEVKVKTTKFDIIGEYGKYIKGSVRSFLDDVDREVIKNFSNHFAIQRYEITSVYPNSETINDVNYSGNFYIVKLFKRENSEIGGKGIKYKT